MMLVAGAHIATCVDKKVNMEDKTPEEAEMCRTALDKSNEIEAAYNKEDEEMMIRLIKIRESLWT